MARRGKKTTPATPRRPVRRADRADGADGFMAGMYQDTINDTRRRDRIVVDELKQLQIGLYLDALSKRILYRNDCLVFGHLHQLCGPPSTYKTAYLFEMMRWHITPPESKGGGLYILNEGGRDQPDWMDSILQYQPPDGPRQGLSGRVRWEVTRSLEDWQDRITTWIKGLYSYCGIAIEGKEAFFRSNDNWWGRADFPFMIGLDSIMGSACQGVVDKIWTDGHASKNFAEEANLIKTYLQSVPQFLSHWPASWVYTNHLKTKPNASAPWITDKRTPGGAAIKFCSMFELTFETKEKDKSNKIDDNVGTTVIITPTKNSSGESQWPVAVNVLWWNDEETGEQITVWDWHSATVEILRSQTGAMKTAVEGVVDIHSVNVGGRTASSDALGLDKASWSEIGKAIETNDEMRQALNKLFGIRKRRPWRPNVPYSQQIEEALVEIRASPQPVVEEPT